VCTSCDPLPPPFHPLLQVSSIPKFVRRTRDTSEAKVTNDWTV